MNTHNNCIDCGEPTDVVCVSCGESICLDCVVPRTSTNNVEEDICLDCYESQRGGE